MPGYVGAVKEIDGDSVGGIVVGATQIRGIGQVGSGVIKYGHKTVRRATQSLVKGIAGRG